MNTATADAWNAKYLAGSIPWDRGEMSPALSHWLGTGELAPCHILVPGCGRGHEAVELAGHGFQVTALDIAPAAIEHLRGELARASLTGELVAADALNWQPAQTFDAIYEQTCLCALDPVHWAEYERQLQRWLRPGGRLYALFMQVGRPGGPPYHCDLGAMRELFPATRWQWPPEKTKEVPHPNGAFEYAAILIRK